MQELVGRISSLDPDASESLKVITYFDALVGAGASTDALLRAASTLSGVPAGSRVGHVVSRRDPQGRPLDGEPPVRSPRREVPGGEVWLERRDPLHANDEMVVERLALAVSLSVCRHHPEGAHGVAIDRHRPLAERAPALSRLRLVSRSAVRVVALPGDGSPAGSAPVPTTHGLLRVAIDDGVHPPPRAGLGTWVHPDHLPDSWDAAVTALRLTTAHEPVVDAEELGALLLVVTAFDPQNPPADVRAVTRLDQRSREVLHTLALADSIRAAAARLGLHHSTLQARHETLVRELGYDPRSALGRARYVAAELCARLALD